MGTTVGVGSNPVRGHHDRSSIDLSDELAAVAEGSDPDLTKSGGP
jgi:hypothetical protein